MDPAASGGHLRDNQPHHTCQRLSFPRWTVRASSANRPKAIIFFARPLLQSTCCLVFAYLRRPIRGYAEDQHILCSSSVSMYVPLGLRVPSASRPKVVSPTVAPRSLGPIFERGVASTLWAPSASRSATLRAGRRDGGPRSTVRAHLQKIVLSSRKQNFSCSNRYFAPKL